MLLETLGPLAVAVGATLQSVRFFRERRRALVVGRAEARTRAEHRSVDLAVKTAKKDFTAWVLVAAGSVVTVIAIWAT